MLGEVRKVKIMGTRRAIQDSLAYAHLSANGMAEFLTYLCKIDKTHKTGIEQNVLALQFAKIRAAINDQRAPIPQWLNYAYGPDIEQSDKSRQCRLVGLTIAARLTPSPCSLKRRDRMQQLCKLAVEDYRLGMFMGKTLPVSIYVESMEVLENNFARDWAPSRDDAFEIIKGLDSDGVGHVSKVVREIREAEEC